MAENDTTTNIGGNAGGCTHPNAERQYNGGMRDDYHCPDCDREIPINEIRALRAGRQQLQPPVPPTPPPTTATPPASAPQGQPPPPPPPPPPPLGTVVACPDCGGTGEVTAGPFASGPGGPIAGNKVACQTCNGSGRARYVGGSEGYRPVGN